MPAEVCDICGSTNLLEIKCKVICQNCGTILKSCADLSDQLLRIADKRHCGLLTNCGLGD
jgi:transcription initiation factor TFIIIB Brf1 subunit/transcription initiation factor TFIIB